MKNKLAKKLIALAVVTVTVAGFPIVGASAYWKHSNKGWWNSKGDNYSIGWEKVGSNWFFFDEDGYMKTGWIKDGNKWYFLSPDGYMKTGWISNGGKWYFLNASGEMAHDTTIDGYKLSSDGVWVTDNSSLTTTNSAVVVSNNDITPESTTGASVTISNNDQNRGKHNGQKKKIAMLLNFLTNK